MSSAEVGLTGAEPAPVQEPPPGLALGVLERGAKIVVGLATLSVLVFTFGQVVDRHVLKGGLQCL